MKTIIHFLIICFFLLASCTDSPLPSHTNETQENPSPQVLVEEKGPYSLGKLSRTGYEDFISLLFSEALEKDADLQELHRRIYDMNKLTYDSLQAYDTYAGNHEKYWENALSYANSIQDTVLRKSIQDQVISQKSAYYVRIADHLKKREKINDKTMELADQLILLKLAVTYGMMQNYQENELPDMDALDKVLDSYDERIKETKAYVGAHP